jgi:hypothetical protein
MEEFCLTEIRGDFMLKAAKSAILEFRM